jgi:hypothetical protein
MLAVDKVAKVKKTSVVQVSKVVDFAVVFVIDRNGFVVADTAAVKVVASVVATVA